MLFYKPESYLLPQSESPTISKYTQSNPNQIKPDRDPTRGAAGDPYKMPIKYADILK